MTDSRNIQRNLTNMRSSLYSFAMMLTSNSDHAYDLVQDTTVCAIREADTLDANNLKSAVLGIMRNIYITNYRRVALEATLADTTDTVYNFGLADEVCLEAPEGCLSTDEVLSRMEQLTAQTRSVYTLYIKGYTYAEIADRLDMDIRQVRKSVSHASDLM